MESVEQIVQLAMNSGMSLLITCYFLYRDWKYQDKLTGLMSTLTAAIDSFKAAVGHLGGGNDGNGD